MFIFHIESVQVLMVSSSYFSCCLRTSIHCRRYRLVSSARRTPHPAYIVNALLTSIPICWPFCLPNDQSTLPAEDLSPRTIRMLVTSYSEPVQATEIPSGCDMRGGWIPKPFRTIEDPLFLWDIVRTSDSLSTACMSFLARYHILGLQVVGIQIQQYSNCYTDSGNRYGMRSKSVRSTTSSTRPLGTSEV